MMLFGKQPVTAGPHPSTPIYNSVYEKIGPPWLPRHDQQQVEHTATLLQFKPRSMPCLRCHRETHGVNALPFMPAEFDNTIGPEPWPFGHRLCLICVTPSGGNIMTLDECYRLVPRMPEQPKGE